MHKKYVMKAEKIDFTEGDIDVKISEAFSQSVFIIYFGSFSFNVCIKWYYGPENRSRKK
jgi:hypothetical protein